MRCLALLFVLALAACSENANDDASTSPSPSCSYPDASNGAGCPEKYSASFNGQKCPTAGLSCAYPGVGDQQSDGCWATAVLGCYRERLPDGGANDAAPTWRAAQ
jgi:hypothetical protein